jgi:imidazolonepropionase-like amidohydrolase
LFVPAGILDPGPGRSTSAHALLVENGRIKALVPKAEAESVDGSVERRICAGSWIVPGFVNMHEYLSVDPDRPDPMGRMFSPDIPGRSWSAARSLAKDIASGVTTMRIMGEGDSFDTRVSAAVASGEIVGPALVTSGFPITPTHGHQRGSRGFDGKGQIRKAVRRNLRDGVAWIKVVLTGGVNAAGLGPRDPAYSREEIRAVVEEAHRAGRPVAGAAHGGPAVRIALEEGVETIEHASLFEEADVEAVTEHGAVVVLTLSRFFHPEGIRKSARNAPHVLNACERACEAMRRSVPLMLRSGVKIALGTDNMHGYMARDIEYLIELGAGMPAALTAATAAGAAALHRADIGGLSVGMRADFMLLPADPTLDAAALSAPQEVYVEGRRRV